MADFWQELDDLLKYAHLLEARARYSALQHRSPGIEIEWLIERARQAQRAREEVERMIRSGNLASALQKMIAILSIVESTSRGEVPFERLRSVLEGEQTPPSPTE